MALGGRKKSPVAPAEWGRWQLSSQMEGSGVCGWRGREWWGKKKANNFRVEATAERRRISLLPNVGRISHVFEWLIPLRVVCPFERNRQRRPSIGCSFAFFELTISVVELCGLKWICSQHFWNEIVLFIFFFGGGLDPPVCECVRCDRCVEVQHLHRVKFFSSFWN